MLAWGGVGGQFPSEIWPLGGFFTDVLILANLHTDKELLFLRCQECLKCIENLGPKQWNLRSLKLPPLLINGAEINANKVCANF